MTSKIMILSLGFVLAGCGSLSRLDFNEEPNNDLEKIIFLSSLAGNSHNTQPWSIQVENDSTIYIFADFSRKLHIVDPDARGLFISLGAFIENFYLASGSLGYSCNIEINAKGKDDSLAATIVISKSEKTGYDISKIERRRTIRKPFKSTVITDNDLEKIVLKNSKNTYFFSSSSDMGKYIALQTFNAYSQQATDEQAKQELANWVRFSNSEVRAHRDGLTTSGMDITGIGGFFVRSFYKPETSMSESFINKGIELTKQQVDNCGGWIVITQNSDSPENWIKTGRLYQRMNLQCTDLMVGFHPMNQMIEESNFEKMANQTLALNGVIQFVARIGYVDKYPEPVSVRRPLKDIIRK